MENVYHFWNITFSIGFFKKLSITIEECYSILFYHFKKLLYQLYHTILQYILHPKPNHKPKIKSNQITNSNPHPLPPATTNPHRSERNKPTPKKNPQTQLTQNYGSNRSDKIIFPQSMHRRFMLLQTKRPRWIR